MKRLSFLGVVSRYDKTVNSYWGILYPGVKVEKTTLYGPLPTGIFSQIMIIPDPREAIRAQQLSFLFNAPYGLMNNPTIIYNVNTYSAEQLLRSTNAARLF